MVCSVCIFGIVCIFCMLGIICIHAASLTMAFHARPAKYLHLVHAEQRQRRSPTSKTQLKLLNSLNCSRHQHDGTTADVCRHQCDFQDILKINCIICIICIYCIMCTCTGRIHPSRRYALLFANNGYQHNEKTHAICSVPQDFSP